MKISKEGWVIHGFALLHGVVALGCRLLGLADDMMLTLLSMMMVVILCLRCQVSGYLMAFAVLAVNIIGVLLGRGTAWLIDGFTDSPLVIYPLSTFLCTEIIGWTMLLIARGYAHRHSEAQGQMASSLTWLLIAFVIVLVTRLAILLLFSEHWEGRNTAVTLLLDYSLTLAVVVMLAEYALRLQRRAMAASEKAHQAQFRYHRLKQQVNPHFLFNSLNVLDYLIQEQTREDASRYTHKLAEVYRYMIKSEDESTVHLRDEMDFVTQYIDLLKVRFPEGLEVEVDIPEEALSCSVVPCAVQLLIENATKHNAVQPANPLRVQVRVEEDRLVVSNNRIPKITHRPASTGLGLQYIRQQYQDLSGQAISILEDEHRYTVILPLL